MYGTIPRPKYEWDVKKKLNKDLFTDNICQLSRVVKRSQTTHVLQEYETDKRDSLRHTPQLPKPISPLFLRFQETQNDVTGYSALMKIG